ncbi:hypothetical protein SAMN05216489_06968 [Streptomyces sp. 3213]|uniref:hypothetical protein n=1 Tax=Streptomyces sp. 3213.3 TaxID=1855348 RepID=UPI00089CF60F|nr:hypothetical protein [Streptomyces sp. 3213.3]SEE52725.1 hypothetical protein SAMN05216489_06968 [Streptomyces sp. 3213] [Streptomyces sp. 3213.3]
MTYDSESGGSHARHGGSTRRLLAAIGMRLDQLGVPRRTDAASDHDALPDVAVGHHLDYGIVAANPEQLAANTWMLKRLGLHPIPGRPTLYALADQQRDGPNRYTLPNTTDRDEALAKVADATLSMHRSDLRVAIHPRLAQDVAARRTPAPVTATRHAHSQRGTTGKSPIHAAAPASRAKRRSPLPPLRLPAARPVDPRVAFSRNR